MSDQPSMKVLTEAINTRAEVVACRIHQLEAALKAIIRHSQEYLGAGEKITMMAIIAKEALTQGSDK